MANRQNQKDLRKPNRNENRNEISEEGRDDANERAQGAQSPQRRERR